MDILAPVKRIAFSCWLKDSSDDIGNRYSSRALASDIKRTGFWGMVHEARAYLTMLLGCIYLAIVDAGRRSADRLAKE